MAKHETRFQANLNKKRVYALAAGAGCLGVGYLRDTSGGTSFPSGLTLLATFLVVLAIELRYQVRGARALRISESGITLERWFGNKTLRLFWNDLETVELKQSPTGPIWTFMTKDGRRIRWAQLGFDGDQRLELEKTLSEGLRHNGIRIKLA